MSPVRCPREDCGEVFDLPPERFGRNIYCIACGTRMTAKPLGLSEAIAERTRTAAGGAGATIARLPFAVVVDNVRSLWNVGSMFRTADACGVAHLVLTGITGTPPRREITKTALGAEECVAWTYEADVARAIDDLGGDGFVPVALEATERSVPIGAFRWPERVALVVGNEVAGVSEAALERCTDHVHIPMAGVKRSLNVAVAFGIAAHAVAASTHARIVDDTLR